MEMVESRENAIKLISSVACANICSSFCSNVHSLFIRKLMLPMKYTTHRVHWTCSRKDVHALNRRYIMCQPNKKPTKYILPSLFVAVALLFCARSNSVIFFLLLLLVPFASFECAFLSRVIFLSFGFARVGRVLYNAYNMYISDMKKP